MKILSQFTILIFFFTLTISINAQTRGAIAVTVTENSNLGFAQGAIGGLGTIESRKNKFGFSLTGTFGQARKNIGGAGTQGNGSGDLRYFFHKDVFLSGGMNGGGYSVKSFSKSAIAITTGAGITNEVLTFSGQYGRDISGVTRRSLFIVRLQIYTMKKVLIGKPYFEVQAAGVKFNQQGPQTGLSLRTGVGFWFGSSKMTP